MEVELVTAASTLSETYNPMNLIDNRKDTFFATADPNPNNKKLLWVQLELTNVAMVSEVHVVNRMDDCDGCGERFSNVDVRVGNNVVDSSTSNANQQSALKMNALCANFPGKGKTAETVQIHCDSPIKGRYVTLQIMDTAVTDMNIAEIDIYSPAGSNGT